MECAHCGAENPKRACGNECGTLYCNDNCAQADWIGDEMSHFEFCGKHHGGGGKHYWAKDVHLHKGRMGREAAARHESVKALRKQLKKDIHRSKGHHEYSASMRRQEQFLENVREK